MNARVVRTLVRCARKANHLANQYARLGQPEKSHEWRQLCRAHMTAVRQLRADQCSQH